MQSLSLLSPFLFAALTAGAASHAGVAGTTLSVNGRQLTLAGPPSCAGANRPARQLAKYLAQYDPASDPKDDIYDETPYTRQEIGLMRDGIVEQGFHYPNGQESVITWMDADGDGICDFAASAGMGGKLAIDRMFLFRGLPKGGYKLMDAYHDYKNGSIVIIPYIPLAAHGEKRPILASRDTLSQWRDKLKALVTCESMTYGPQAAKHRAAAPTLAMLCPKAGAIYEWAAKQLPHQNEMPHSSIEPEAAE